MSKLHLTSDENTMLSRIVVYGDRHGFPNEDIRIAAKVAYIESTFDPDAKNRNSSASGLFQYENGTWHDHHVKLGEKNNVDNQIAAFYDDLARYHAQYAQASENLKENVRFDEYVYIGHKRGENFVKRHDLDDVLKSDALRIWDSDKKANSFDPAWIDDVHSHNHPSVELPDQLLNQSEPDAILAAIESGMASGLSLQIIAEQLADLSFPQEITAQTLDRQMLADAWNQLLENVGEDQLAEIDTVYQSGNRIDVDFQDGSSAVLTCLSSGAEVDQFDDGGDLLSNNWWNTDGSYGNYTYDIDGSFTNTSYAADGSFSSYTDDGAGNSDLNDYSADGTALDDGAVFADDDSGYATDDASNGDTDADYTADDGFDSDV